MALCYLLVNKFTNGNWGLQVMLLFQAFGLYGSKLPRVQRVVFCSIHSSKFDVGIMTFKQNAHILGREREM